MASADVLRIWRYIKLDDRPMTASAVFDRILSGVEILAQNPEIGRSGKASRTRELIFPDLPYVAIYRVDPRRKTVEILRVVHGAQNWPSKR